jgi:hypothetical protein
LSQIMKMTEESDVVDVEAVEEESGDDTNVWWI